MRRYIGERCYPLGLDSPADATGAMLRLAIVERTAEHGVTWLRTYVSEDKTKTFCVYDGPSPEAIRGAAHGNDLPVDQITQVSVLDPYFHH